MSVYYQVFMLLFLGPCFSGKLVQDGSSLLTDELGFLVVGFLFVVLVG